MSPDIHFHLVDGYVSRLSLTTTRLSEKQESLTAVSAGEKAQTVDILRACVVDPRDRSRGILGELSRKAISGAFCSVQIPFIPKLISFYGRDQWRNDESCMKNIDYFLSLSPPRNHDILLEAIKLVSNLTCNMANVAAPSFLPVGSPLATVILCWYLWWSVRSILNSKNQARYLFGVE